MAATAEDGKEKAEAGLAMEEKARVVVAKAGVAMEMEVVGKVEAAMDLAGAVKVVV